MKNNNVELEYKNKKYNLVFNLNVMEAVQEEYETLDNWGSLTDGSKGEPNAKAVIFGFTQMINEGIDIANEEKEEKDNFLTLKQVGRMITEIGLQDATKKLNKAVIESTKDDEQKNV